MQLFLFYRDLGFGGHFISSTPAILLPTYKPPVNHLKAVFRPVSAIYLLKGLQQTGDDRVRRGGVIISGFYAAVIFGLLMPSFLVISRLPLKKGQGFEWWHVYPADAGSIVVVMFGLILVGGQALLLFLSVDTSWRRLKPRRHIAASAALTGFFTALLASSAVFISNVWISR
ncbi:MAG: hypothetical protein V3V86_04530 [Gammaproteobacteria bacterium]